MASGETNNSASAFDTGSLIAGKYRVERVLGRGGMGVVLEASHVQLEQSVAIKFLLAEASELHGAHARFLREARAAARIRSEHVARVIDIDTTADGVTFLVMELLVGQDLHEVVRRRGALPVADAIDYVLQACEALAEAHALGIVHRDLKPGNLFLTRRLDGSPLVKLLDFGIAKAPATQEWSEGSLTVTRGTLGSPLYMSPEQLRDTSSVDHRTDIWALGIILFELMTGHHPFEAGSQAALGAQIATGSPVALGKHLDDVPVGLDAVITRCLQKEAAARFESVGAFAAALRPFVGASSRASLDRIASVSLLSSSNKTVLAVPRSNAPPPLSRAVSPESGVRSTRSPTDNFRRQHEELANLGGELLQQLSLPDVAARAAELRRNIARFAGKLNMHASMENEALYPRLLEHTDTSVREKAQDLFDEVKGIYSAFAAYAKKWPTVESIQSDPLGFAKETKRVLKTLWMRMARENEELYPLVDAAG
jgi:eukaryotic-like serine/threonine-protein kinase